MKKLVASTVGIAVLAGAFILALAVLFFDWVME